MQIIATRLHKEEVPSLSLPINLVDNELVHLPGRDRIIENARGGRGHEPVWEIPAQSSGTWFCVASKRPPAVRR